MEGHQPVPLPSGGSIKVSLKFETIMGRRNRHVDDAVISKEAEFAVGKVIREIVYVNEKENRAKDSALGHARCDRDCVGCQTIKDNCLGAVR